jgi:nucleoside-diphosphate-sugar epimerase
VSTVYIAGKTPGALAEASFINETGFFNTYQESKYDAERLVVAAMTEIPAVVFRLSSIIGHSQTGAISQFNYFHQLLRFIPENPLPIIPGIPDTPVDLIASDWAIGALSSLYESRFEPGRIFNVCAGPANSLTAAEALSLAFKDTGETPPRLVSMEEFERFTRNRPRLQRVLNVVLHFLPQIAIRQSFESESTLGLLAGLAVHLPDIRVYYPKVIENCLPKAAQLPCLTITT